MSQRDRKIGSIWELNPWDCKEHSYEELEALFLAAWEYRFHYRPATSVVRPYLQRYLRFRIVAPWVSLYARDMLQEGAMGNIADAPLDPAIDLRLYPWHLLHALFGCPAAGVRGRGDKTGFEA